MPGGGRGDVPGDSRGLARGCLERRSVMRAVSAGAQLGCAAAVPFELLIARCRAGSARRALRIGMARPPSSGGPGPRPPLGGNGSGSGRAGTPGNGTAGKKRSSPAGAVLGQRRQPRGGCCRARAPPSRAAGAPCSLPSATGNVFAFLLQASEKRRFLILVENSISPARGAAWPAPSCLASQRIAEE